MAFQQGAAAAETLTGTAGADTLLGRGGADVLYGQGGRTLSKEETTTTPSTAGAERRI